MSLRYRIPFGTILGACFRLSRGVITQVLAGRNDDYGDRPVERLLACIEWNQRWLNCSTVFVEWNPPPDKPLLSVQLVDRFPEVACYVVTPLLHAAVAVACSRQFLEYHAKNAGIRRATTPWIAACNTDVIVLPDCRPSLKRLDPRDVARTRRVDFPFSGKTPALFQVLDGRKYLRFRCIEGIGASAPGDFTLAHRDLWHRARGYDEANVERRVLCDVRGMHQLCAVGGKVRWVGTHLHFDHPESTSSGTTASHGPTFQPDEGVPYVNPVGWGLGDATVRQLDQRIWELDV